MKIYEMFNGLALIAFICFGFGIAEIAGGTDKVDWFTPFAFLIVSGMLRFLGYAIKKED